MKKLYILAILIMVITIISIPFIEVNYYNGGGMETKKYSIVSSLIEDVKERSFMTIDLIINN